MVGSGKTSLLGLSALFLASLVCADSQSVNGTLFLWRDEDDHTACGKNLTAGQSWSASEWQANYTQPAVKLQYQNSTEVHCQQVADSNQKITGLREENLPSSCSYKFYKSSDDCSDDDDELDIDNGDIDQGKCLYDEEDKKSTLQKRRGGGGRGGGSSGGKSGGSSSGGKGSSKSKSKKKKHKHHNSDSVTDIKYVSITGCSSSS